MILSALVKRYENQLAEGKIPKPGWSKAKISFGLRLNESGEIADIIDLRTEVQSGKKTVRVSQKKEVPEQITRSSNVLPYFLCDKAAYLFGMNGNEKSFESAKKLHLEILANCNSPTSTAIKNFFFNWEPSKFEDSPKLQKHKDDLTDSTNFVFTFDNQFAYEDEEIREAWENYKKNQISTTIMQCLITGKILPIAEIHPVIKGVRKAHAAGASIVSFNASAFESYGHSGDQGFNAPVSEYAAFAYTTALNDLLSDSTHVKYFGDTTVVYWAEENSDACQDVLAEFLEPSEKETTNQLLNMVMEGIQKNRINYEGADLNFENPFYILGLSANEARLSVRFFLKQNFGAVLKNLAKHYSDLKIVKPSYKKYENIPLWQILASTVSPKSKDKTPSPIMSGAAVRAIMSGQKYPVSLFQNVLMRIKAENDDTHEKVAYEQAAFIKAYLVRNKGKEISMALDEKCTDKNYVNGRIFAVLEAIQSAANPGLNATIKDKYFNAACTTPNRIFPNLHKLSVHHLRKLEAGQKVYYEKQLQNLMEKMDPAEKSPARLSPEEQGMFILGYYQQTRERYKTKEERENG